MRHGLTVVLFAIGLGLFGFERAGESSEPLDNRVGLRIQPIFLLTRVDVQTDLKLMPDQIADANRVGDDLYRKAQLLRGKSGPAVDEEKRKIDYALTQWLDERLTADQFDRLREIDLQWEGAAAMVRPIEAEYLGLTPEQQQKVRQLVKESMKPRTLGSWTASDQLQLNWKAVAILSDKQKERWGDLLGKPCQFSFLGQKARQASPSAARGTEKRQQPGR